MAPSKGVYLPISKLHSMLAVANSLAINNLWLYHMQVAKFATAKIEWSLKMGKYKPLRVPFILLLIVSLQISYIIFVSAEIWIN